ncbi:hypothetical protein EVAR_35936_1 [Eumeta japonica]|uniref:Uncharacterized protein n=1 Tax=Eumeta variegata TaxID=151549 RepID=A0A4C1W584_EUMVA|nr:hypothetical protein EVAR_35936_1 [Eumeta japonica]
MPIPILALILFPVPTSSSYASRLFPFLIPIRVRIFDGGRGSLRPRSPNFSLHYSTLPSNTPPLTPSTPSLQPSEFLYLIRAESRTKAILEHVPLTGTDDSWTAQCLVNTAGGVVLPNQVFSNSFSPEPLHADEHYYVEEQFRRVWNSIEGIFPSELGSVSSIVFSIKFQ